MELNERNRRAEMASRAERGLAGQGAVVDAMFELKDAIDRSNDAATRLGRTIKNLNWWLLGFTAAICVLTLVLVDIAGRTFMQGR